MNNLNDNIETSFNIEFCTHLEYHLTESLANTKNTSLKGFWCDGISSQPIGFNFLKINKVNELSQINTIAWIGKDGQDEYKMIINLDKKSLKNISEGIILIDCILEANTTDWFDIDIKRKVIKIKLK